MAKMEHESWMKHLTDNGWRYGEKRDNARRLHPSLRGFDTLSADDQEKTRQGVTNALGTLESLGYRSTVLRQQSVTGVADHDQQSDYVMINRFMIKTVLIKTVLIKRVLIRTAGSVRCGVVR